MPLQLLKRLREHAAARANDIAICEIGSGGRRVTFGQLLSMVARFARDVEAAVAPGGVVAICLPNRVECTVAFLGTLRAGRTGFLINPHVSDHELARAVDVAEAQALVVVPESDRLLDCPGLERLNVSCEVGVGGAPGPDRADDPALRPGLMLLSSGTTGDPKIVMRGGAAIDAVARNIAEATGMSAGDRVLGLVPLCHSYGVEHGILAPAYAGCTVHLCQGFDIKAVIQELLHADITVFPGVPSAFEMIASVGDPAGAFPSLRCAYSAGALLPLTVFESCRRRWGLRVGQLYGSSEVGSVTFNDPMDPAHDPQSVGRPMSGVSAVVVDPAQRNLTAPLPPGVEGELAIRAPSMLHGYAGQSESPLHDGYFLTGDLARIDTRGAITITGRTRLLIDVGALKVNPLEVEGVLSQCDGVRECVVLAVPVSDTVSRVRALVVPEDLAAPPTPEAVRRFARSRLSVHKVPRVIDVVDALPKSPTGKVLRRQVAS